MNVLYAIIISKLFLLYISSYILKVKFDQEDDTNGIVYLWVGSKTDPEDIKLAEEIADDMFNDASITKYNNY